jgi:hypothetical protein
MMSTTTLTEATITITVTRTYVWTGDPSTIPGVDWQADGHDSEEEAGDALYSALDTPSDPVTFIDWINAEMDLDDETVEIDEVV